MGKGYPVRRYQTDVTVVSGHDSLADRFSGRAIASSLVDADVSITAHSLADPVDIDI